MRTTWETGKITFITLWQTKQTIQKLNDLCSCPRIFWKAEFKNNGPTYTTKEISCLGCSLISWDLYPCFFSSNNTTAAAIAQIGQGLCILRKWQTLVFMWSWICRHKEFKGYAVLRAYIDIKGKAWKARQQFAVALEPL